MPIVEWGEEYLLGIKEFDAHHEHLVHLLNWAYDECTGGSSSETIDGIVGELAAYAAYHFTAEERWMSDNSYPKLEEHKAEHANFSQRVAAFQNEICNGNAALSTSLVSFLVEWLTAHILDSDTDYGKYIAGRVS